MTSLREVWSVGGRHVIFSFPQKLLITSLPFFRDNRFPDAAGTCIHQLPTENVVSISKWPVAVGGIYGCDESTG
jgi:hypothetical protein